MKIMVTQKLLKASTSRMLLWEKKMVTAFVFLLATVFAQAQNITVKGRVTNESGQGVPSASVTVKGTAIGVTTGDDGSFQISAPSNGTLLISSVGYGTIEVDINGRTTVNATLSTSGSTMEQVVVVGYGTQRKKDVTGSVASVNLEAMENAPNTNIGQYLQGTVPGLNVGISTFAGGTPPISIRGQVTLGGSQDVLIILDGIIYTGSLSSINPDDIASIDVLKDASSTAVYGAQAANGVILITTRKGKSGQKARIAYSGSYSTQSPTVDYRPMNRAQFLQFITDAFWSDAYLAPDYTQPNPSFDVASKVDASMRDASGNLLPNDFDWWKASTGTGHIVDNSLSISGGTNNINYLLSGGLVDQKGFINNDLFKRKSIRANLETRPFEWWKIGLQSSGSFVNQDGAEPSMGVIAISSPLLVPFDANGELIPSPTNTVVSNPFLTYYVDDRDRNQYYFANIYSDLNIPFIKGLNYRVNFGNNLRNSQHYYASRYGAGLTGQAYKDDQQYYDYTLDNILNYSKTFGRHDLTVTALYGASERKFNRTYAEGRGFSRLNLSYNDLNSAATKVVNPNPAPGKYAWNEALNYQMGRINYKYNDKYLVTATLRRDGFSGFAENYKYATFPSVGLGWIVSSENFMSSIASVNLLKLRATYGAIGNQTRRYYSLARVSTNSAYVFGDGAGTAIGQQVSSLSNPNLKWERTQGLNFGLDFGLINNKLTGSVEYYNNNTYDLLFNVQIPTVTGFDQISTNVGQIHNTGFEAQLTYNIVRSNDFTWSATYNFWRNKNEIKKLTGIDANGDGKEDDLVSSGLFIGKSINTIFDYQAGPIYQVNDTRLPGFQVGSLSVIDQNKDGDITSDDRVFIGMREPAYRMSLYNTLNYKGFSFSFFINSIQGGKDGYLANNVRLYFRDDNNIRNNDLDAAAENYWSPRNPGGKYPRIISGSHSKVEPALWESRSFVRLQDISLGYSLRGKVLDKIKAQNLSLYISAKNLITLTKWDGWDPETLVPSYDNNGNFLGDTPNGLRTDGRPAMRVFTFGVHITY